MELFKLFGTIAVNNSEANKSIKDTSSKASALGSTFTKVGGKVSAFGQGMTNVGKKITTGMLAASAAVVGGTTAIYKFAQSTASAADNVDKMSQKIGISRQAYQELDFICSQSGTSVDNLQMGVKTLTAQMDKANAGNKTATANFEKLGVAVTNADGSLRSQEEVLFDTMSALQGVENQTEKARLATQLFGKSGTELMPLLNGASGSIEEMRKQAHDLGLVLSDEVIDDGVEFTDTMDQLKRSLGKVGQTIGAELMPYITQFAQYIIAHLPQIRQMVGKLVEKLKELGRHIKDVVNWYRSLDSSQQKLILKIGALVVALGPLLIAIGKMTSGVGAIISLFGRLFSAIGSLSSASSGLSAAFGGISASALAIVAAIGVLVAAFVTLWNTNEEFRNNIIAIWNEIKQTFTNFCQGIVEEINSLGFDFENIAEVIKAVWSKLCTFLAPIFEGAFKTISNFFKHITGTIINLLKIFTGLFKGNWKKVLEGVKGIVKTQLQAIKNFFTNILSTLNKLTGGKLLEMWNHFKEKLTNIKNTVSEKFNNVKTTVSNAISNVKTTISNGLTNARETVHRILESIKKKFTDAFDKVKETVRKAIDKVKGFFDFDWKLPDIKLPKFHVQGGKAPWGFMGKGSLPEVSVEWYRKGGIMDGITPFGVNGDKLMMGGEAGKEAIIPLEQDTKGIELIANKLAENMPHPDTSILQEKMNEIIEILASIYRKDQSIKIDGREFGRMVNKYA